MNGKQSKRLRRLAFARDREFLTALVKVAERRMQSIVNVIQLYRLGKRYWGRIKYEVPRPILGTNKKSQDRAPVHIL